MEWAGEFNSLLGTRGEDVCVIGYEGFVRTGSKGAVSCYSDGDGAGPPPLLTYTTLEELLSDERMPPEVKVRGLRTNGRTPFRASFPCMVRKQIAFTPHPPYTWQSRHKEQMAERVMSYDPELEVAVMFAYKGQVRCCVSRLLSVCWRGGKERKEEGIVGGLRDPRFSRAHGSHTPSVEWNRSGST